MILTITSSGGQITFSDSEFDKAAEAPLKTVFSKGFDAIIRWFCKKSFDTPRSAVKYEAMP
jgi:hypothetical protein